MFVFIFSSPCWSSKLATKWETTRCNAKSAYLIVISKTWQNWHWICIRLLHCILTSVPLLGCRDLHDVFQNWAQKQVLLIKSLLILTFFHMIRIVQLMSSFIVVLRPKTSMRMSSRCPLNAKRAFATRTTRRTTTRTTRRGGRTTTTRKATTLSKESLLLSSALSPSLVF